MYGIAGTAYRSLAQYAGIHTNEGIRAIFVKEHSVHALLERGAMLRAILDALGRDYESMDALRDNEFLKTDIDRHNWDTLVERCGLSPHTAQTFFGLSLDDIVCLRLSATQLAAAGFSFTVLLDDWGLNEEKIVALAFTNETWWDTLGMPAHLTQIVRSPLNAGAVRRAPASRPSPRTQYRRALDDARR